MAEPEILKPGDIPGKDPIKKLEQRVKELEDRRIEVADLPLVALRRAFQKEPQDPLQTLLTKSVTMDLLADDVVHTFVSLAVDMDGAKVDFGSTTVVWPGSTNVSNTITVAHRLGKPPVFAFAVAEANTSSTANMSSRPIIGSFKADTFQYRMFAHEVVSPQSTPALYFAIG